MLQPGQMVFRPTQPLIFSCEFHLLGRKTDLIVIVLFQTSLSKLWPILTASYILRSIFVFSPFTQKCHVFVTFRDYKIGWFFCLGFLWWNILLASQIVTYTIKRNAKMLREQQYLDYVCGFKMLTENTRNFVILCYSMISCRFAWWPGTHYCFRENQF